MARKPRKSPPPFRKVTEAERLQMKELYAQGISSYEVGRRLGRSFKAVLNHLRDMDVEIRDDSHCQKKYTLNETYFENIDTPEKAYVLGFIYADGNVKGNRLKIALWDKDRELLERFSAAMGFNGPLGREEKTRPNRSDMCVLNVFGRTFCNHLKDKGVMENKVHRIQLPTFLPDDLLRHFVLGYFDGDGSIFEETASKDGLRYVVTFAGHEGFIRSLQSYFEKAIGVKGSFVVGEGKGRCLSFNSTRALRVANFLYANPPPFLLRRKWDRFKTIVEKLQSRRKHKSPETLPHIDAGLQILSNVT